MADAYRALGGLDSALVLQERSLPLWRELRDSVGEANTLHNVGLVYFDLGRPDSALAYFRQALTIHRAGADSSGEAATLSNLGSVHMALGRPDSAIFYHARALQILRELNEPGPEATTLNNIGGALNAVGEHETALTYYAEALRIRRELSDRGAEATTLNNIGRLHDALGRSDSALFYYALALPLRQLVGDREGEARTLSNIGLVQVALGFPDSSLANFTRALALQRGQQDRLGEATTLHNIGYALLIRSASDSSARAAAAAFDTSAALQARTRHSAGSDANAVSFSEISGDTYIGWSSAWQVLADLARTAGDTGKRQRALASALAAADRGRAQALRDLLDQREMTSGLPYASDTIAGAELAVEAGNLVAPLRAARTALIYYLMDGDTLRTWFLGSNGNLEMPAPIPQEIGALGREIVTTREALGADASAVRRHRGGSPVAADVSRGFGTAPADLRAAAKALGELSASVLPAGLASLLPAGTELVIVPHGSLGQVPFAALTLPGDTLPLGVRNPLRYAPSLRALAAAEAAMLAARQRALVVGNPQMPEVRDDTGDLHKLSELPGAAEEGRWVATKLGTRPMTGSAASERAVRDLLASASIVHLATHGLAYGTEERVRDSYVALASGFGHDGLLTLGELLDDDSLRLIADLIVLSACQTGLGESRDAEGTVGLQRGLLAKGARSVLVSLWSVDDAATLLLMKRFYTHWLDESGRPRTSKAEALRSAQRDVRAEKRFENPRYWAAFQLVGAR